MSSGSRPLFQRNSRSFRQWPSLLTMITVAHRLVGAVQLPHHLEGLGEGLQLELEILQRQLVARELHPHEEQAGVVVVVLGRLFDVAAALQQEAGNGMHDARPVRAGKGQDISVVHIRRRLSQARRRRLQSAPGGAKMTFCSSGDPMAYNDFNMDNHWLPFTPNRQFRKDPRVFVAADGMHFTTHDGKKGGRRHLQPVVRGRGPQPQAHQRGDQEAAGHARLRHGVPGVQRQGFQGRRDDRRDGAGRPEQGAVLQLRLGGRGHLTEGGAGLSPRPRRRPPQRLHRPREGLPRRRFRRHERGRHSGQPQGVRLGASCRASTTCASSTIR